MPISSLSSSLITVEVLFQVLVYDFQPIDPEDIYVALAVLSGRAVPGENMRMLVCF